MECRRLFRGYPLTLGFRLLPAERLHRHNDLTRELRIFIFKTTTESGASERILESQTEGIPMTPVYRGRVSTLCALLLIGVSIKKYFHYVKLNMDPLPSEVSDKYYEAISYIQ